jgi:NADH-quinone oxidoreductase subunit B
VLESLRERVRRFLLKTLRLEILFKWGIRWSLWPVHLVTSCCGVEVAHTAGPGFDAERWGVLPFHTMRQCNVILVEGTITMKMARALRQVYEQMPEPKYVMAMGACGVRGGLFWNSYHVVQVDTVVPVDVYIAGCPPTPEAVIRAFIMLHNKIRGRPGPYVEPVRVDIAPPKPPARPAPQQAQQASAA